MTTPQRILFITLSCLGDAVLSTLTLEALHKTYPNTVFDVVSHPRCIEIFRSFPYVESLYEKGAERTLKDHLELLSKLRNTCYDIIVDLRTDGYSFLLKGKKRILKKQNRRTRNLHAAEKHFSAVKSIVSCDYPPDAIVYLDFKHEYYASKIINTENSRTLTIGCGGSTKNQWPLSSYISLINLIHTGSLQIILIGNMEQQGFANQIEQGLKFKIKNMVGKTTLLESAAILKKSDLFIGTDSGLGHLASSVNCPTLTIFGPDEPTRCRPWSARSYWLQGPNKAIDEVTPQQVYDILNNSHLKRQPSHGKPPAT